MVSEKDEHDLSLLLVTAPSGVLKSSLLISSVEEVPTQGTVF